MYGFNNIKYKYFLDRNDVRSLTYVTGMASHTFGQLQLQIKKKAILKFSKTNKTKITII